MWDGLWYRLIAVEGYEGHTAKAAFWPLFPWAMRYLHDWFGIWYEVAGYLIANICFAVALVLLYRLLSLDFDRRIAAASIWALALFPTAFFFTCGLHRVALPGAVGRRTLLRPGSSAGGWPASLARWRR